MWIRSWRLAAVVSVACTSFSEALSRDSENVSPDLHPKSDKKFFGKDYPADKRPVADRHYVFDHPYPAVQDSSDYDRDFVKDENSDGGRWKAQMHYDTLRASIRDAEKKVEEAKRKFEKEAAEWRSAKEKLSESRKSMDVTETEERQAEKAAGDATARVDKLEGDSKTSGTGTGGAVGDAMHKVDDEMTDLEKCEKNLAEAKAKVRELMKEKGKRKLAYQAAQQDRSRAGKADTRTTQRDHHDSEEIRDNEKALAEEEVEERTMAERSWKKHIAAETEEESQVSKSYQRQLAQVKRTEAELAKAADNLRKYRRRPHVDDDGGVYDASERKDYSVHAKDKAFVVLLVVLAAAVMAIGVVACLPYW